MARLETELSDEEKDLLELCDTDEYDVLDLDDEASDIDDYFEESYEGDYHYD